MVIPRLHAHLGMPIAPVPVHQIFGQASRDEQIDVNLVRQPRGEGEVTLTASIGILAEGGYVLVHDHMVGVNQRYMMGMTHLGVN